MEREILTAVETAGSVDSFVFASTHKLEHQAVVGAFKSLEATKFLALEQKSQEKWQLTAEGQDYAANGTLEYRIYKDVVPSEGTLKATLEEKYGKEFSIGFAQCMKRKWLAFNKETGKVNRVADKVDDVDGVKLAAIQKGEELAAADLTELGKRKLVQKSVITYFIASKGPEFSLEIKEEFADISADMLKRKDFGQLSFKPFNLKSLGKEISCGSLHPLLKVRTTFREILLELGFEEMPTNNFVENSFWNFDSLFVPQQHPARDQQDTFFLKEPSMSKIHNPEYWERVKKMHEEGGHGSIGWRYNYSIQESQRNIFRTHTTCVSSKMLARMAEEGFRDAKYFSIDRVFRNETLDATHLAEFHQIEGLVCGKDLGLQHLMGVIKEFFRKIGKLAPHPRHHQDQVQASLQPVHRAQHGDLLLPPAAQKDDRDREQRHLPSRDAEADGCAGRLHRHRLGSRSGETNDDQLRHQQHPQFVRT